MMVPELQGALLDDLQATEPWVRSIYDPFMGSGTVLLESMFRGLEFHGTDINPLAVLLTQVKSSPPPGAEAKAAVESVYVIAKRIREVESHDFLHRDKWFNPKVTHDLSKLRAVISDVTALPMRQFLWICLAETVRRVSNSRMSTFKLHAYDSDTLKSRQPDALQTFHTVGIGNSRRAAAHWRRMSALGAVPNPTLLRASVFDQFGAPRSVDAVMTSPPYGDNHTTVPYGQHSYLPLQWMEVDDIPGTFESRLLQTPASLDTASLGGSRSYRRDLIESLPNEIASTKHIFESLAGSASLEAKAASFIHDYRESLKAVSERLKLGGVSFFTLGERRIKGIELPLVAMTREILEAIGHAHVATVTRQILGKKMAGRNSSGSTMVSEQVLVMRKKP